MKKVGYFILPVLIITALFLYINRANRKTGGRNPEVITENMTDVRESS